MTNIGLSASELLSRLILYEFYPVFRTEIAQALTSEPIYRAISNLSSRVSSFERFILESNSVEQTIRIGFGLGSRSQRGDILCISGELGSGKTHLVKGIGAALGISQSQISSPTYTLIAEHSSGPTPLYHMDAYRIVDLFELGPIGFDDYVGREDGILVIEWSNLIETALPDDRLDIRMSAPDRVSFPNKRLIEFRVSGARSSELALIVKSDFAAEQA